MKSRKAKNSEQQSKKNSCKRTDCFLCFFFIICNTFLRKEGDDATQNRASSMTQLLKKMFEGAGLKFFIRSLEIFMYVN